jgi:hypothetical protein
MISTPFVEIMKNLFWHRYCYHNVAGCDDGTTNTSTFKHEKMEGYYEYRQIYIWLCRNNDHCQLTLVMGAQPLLDVAHGVCGRQFASIVDHRLLPGS